MHRNKVITQQLEYFGGSCEFLEKVTISCQLRLGSNVIFLAAN